MTEVSFLSQNLWSPHEGHIDAVYNIFRQPQNNLAKNPGRIEFDPDFVPTDDQVFEESKRDLEDWKGFKSDSAESHLSKNLEPLG